jgi:cysteinyl-tRNA synthetase
LAAEKGFKRLQAAAKSAKGLAVSNAATPSQELQTLNNEVLNALYDDLNTPIALAHLFEVVRWVNSASDKKTPVHPDDARLLQLLLGNLLRDILGLQEEEQEGDGGVLLQGLMEMILEAREQAKARKDYAASDAIRNQLTALGISIKDTKEGAVWGR